MTLHAYTPIQGPYQVWTSYTSGVSEIKPRRAFSSHEPDRRPAHPDTMGENTCTALKGCWAKTLARIRS